jgi:RHS repeat-associated protein
MIRKWGSSTDTAWYLQGGNYNVEALTDRTGSVIERYEYTPYGKPTIYTGAGTDGKWFTSDDVSSTVSAKGNNILFQGRELDAESGNEYFRARYYHSMLGRFASRDPHFLDIGLSSYRMLLNAPGNRVDPFGGISVNVNEHSLPMSDMQSVCLQATGVDAGGCTLSQPLFNYLNGISANPADPECKDCYHASLPSNGSIQVDVYIPAAGSFGDRTNYDLCSIVHCSDRILVTDQVANAVKNHEYRHVNTIKELVAKMSSLESSISHCQKCGDDAKSKVGDAVAAYTSSVKLAFKVLANMVDYNEFLDQGPQQYSVKRGTYNPEMDQVPIDLINFTCPP